MIPFVRASLCRCLYIIGGVLLAVCTVQAAGEAATEGQKDRNAKRHRVYHTVRLQGPVPTLDGHLDDACWLNQGEWMSGYEQYSPVRGGKASEPTDIKILYDDKNVYVAIRAHQTDPRTISRIASDRDERSGDVVGFALDSYFDHRSAFQFALTAAGQKEDMKIYNAGADGTWNAVWEGKTAMEKDGWTAEFLIPLSQLRYNPANTTWGLHSWRGIDSLNEESDWNLLTNDDTGMVKSFGELQGLVGLKTRRRIELVPFSLAKVETFGKNGSPFPSDTKTSIKGGLDAKIGLTSSLTLDVSILPDFGQVESDPSVMNLTAFETFLEERRTLFLEGNDIFDFPFEEDAPVFYSRRIGQAPGLVPDHLVSRMPETTTLLSAAKVSGKTANGWSIGVLASATDKESADVLENGKVVNMAVEPRTNYVVARAQKEFRDGDTTVGGIVTMTSRDLSNDALKAYKAHTATVAGLDFAHYWADREFYLKGVAIHSQIDGDARAISRLQLSSARYYQRPIDGKSDYDPTRSVLSGSGLLLEGGKASKGHWRANEQFLLKTQGLDFNDLGYLSTADRISQRSQVSYVEKDPAGIILSHTTTLENTNLWSTHGEFLHSETELETRVEFANQWQLSNELVYTGPARDPVVLRGGPLLRVPANICWKPSLSTNRSQRVFGSVSSVVSRSGEGSYSEDTYTAKLSVRPMPPFLASFKVQTTREKDMLRSVVMDSPTGSPGYFVSRLEGRSLSYELNLQWIIRPELRLQYYGNPFGSTIRQSDFRRVVSPLASSYAARIGSTLSANRRDGAYSFDENRDGLEDFWTSDSDGNSSSFRSNLVLKWEYRRGSMLYLVWSQQRGEDYILASDTPADAVSALKSLAPNNQFMIKMTYWFNL
jgi:hypothetical protein